MCALPAALSFRYVPLEHRLLVLNVCSLGVFSYATWVKERDAATAAAALTTGTAARPGAPDSTPDSTPARLAKRDTKPAAVAAGS